MDKLDWYMRRDWLVTHMVVNTDEEGVEKDRKYVSYEVRTVPPVYSNATSREIDVHAVFLKQDWGEDWAPRSCPHQAMQNRRSAWYKVRTVPACTAQHACSFPAS